MEAAAASTGDPVDGTPPPVSDDPLAREAAARQREYRSLTRKWWFGAAPTKGRRRWMSPSAASLVASWPSACCQTCRGPCQAWFEERCFEFVPFVCRGERGSIERMGVDIRHSRGNVLRFGRFMPLVLSLLAVSIRSDHSIPGSRLDSHVFPRVP